MKNINLKLEHKHKFESDWFKSKCLICKLPFNHIYNPDKWDKNGKYIKK